MSSAQQPNLDSSKPSEPTADDKKLPQLGALEEDDEFEEFAEQGQFSSFSSSPPGLGRGPRWLVLSISYKNRS